MKPPKIILYTKPGCSLCDQAKKILLKVQRTSPFTLETVDISKSNDFPEYQDHIPVIMLNGKEISRHQVSEKRLLDLLQNANSQS